MKIVYKQISLKVTHSILSGFIYGSEGKNRGPKSEIIAGIWLIFCTCPFGQRMTSYAKLHQNLRRWGRFLKLSTLHGMTLYLP